MRVSLYAVQHIRRMRGGSQAHLMRASDGFYYVTKFQNSPQGVRILANEMFATSLGLWLGLPMPPVAAIEVSDWLIDNTPELRIELVGRHAPYEFARALGSRMQRQGLHMATDSKTTFDEPSFYNGDVGFVSLNYDPIALWVQFCANRDLNIAAMNSRSPAAPLHLFHNFGHLIPARRIGKPEDDWPWYPLNEGAAQRLNELNIEKQAKVRLTKFLFPHGCLCWRECPDCGKLSAYHGDSWDLHAPGLFPPPPLKAFDTRDCVPWISEEERVQRRRGKVDARKCLHCGTLTYAHHTQAVMQSSYKPLPPSFIEEIQRELRATTMQASHIIFMGYSLPPDDVTYRAFFSARRQRRELPRPMHNRGLRSKASRLVWSRQIEMATEKASRMFACTCRM